MTQVKSLFGDVEIKTSNEDMKRMTIAGLSNNLRNAFNKGYLISISEEIYKIEYVDATKIEIHNINNPDIVCCTQEYLINLGACLVPKYAEGFSND